MPSGEQRQVCWEKINETNRFFRLTHPYSPAGLADQLVAVHALFGCLDQAVVLPSDDQIARTKLDWWRSELQRDSITRSRHPVIRCLCDTGAATALHDRAVENLLAATERKLDARPPADTAELKRLCSDLYRPRIDVESALTGSARLPEEILESMAANGGLIQLVRDTFSSRRDMEYALWWIPLGLLARHGVSRAELAQNLGTASAKSIFSDIYSNAVSSIVVDRPGKPDQRENHPQHIHLLLGAFLHDRQLKRLEKSGPLSIREILGRIYLRDVFGLWRTARKIGKATGS
jgi:phytoene synthase